MVRAKSIALTNSGHTQPIAGVDLDQARRGLDVYP